MASTAEQYHAALHAQADEQVAKLAGKVEKLRVQLAAAEEAHAAAVEQAAQLRADPPAWVEPTEHVTARA